MPNGTAAARLRKSILFHIIKKAGDNICYQCGMEIIYEDELSIEHKLPWLDSHNPVELYFSIDNIAFSHLDCNIKAARPKAGKHPSRRAYQNGCRCDGCKRANADAKILWRSNKKNRNT